MSEISRQSELLNKEEWDFLILLDACRYDAFEQEIEKYPIEGKLEKVDPEVGVTRHWYNKNLEKVKECILISSSPHQWRRENWAGKDRGFRPADEFRKAYPIWKPSENVDGLGMVRPSIQWRQSREIIEENDPPFLIHLIPPHLPFLGPRGGQIMWNFYDTIEEETREKRDDEPDKYCLYDPLAEWADEHDKWKILRYAYRENVDIAIESVLSHASLLDGKVIITSDHGERIGENRRFGHKRMPVPWFEVEDWLVQDWW